MSGRPFLSHTDAPTPHTFSRPAFVPALKFGGGLGFGPGNAGRGSSGSVAAPARPAPSVGSSQTHAAVSRPAAAAFGGGGGGGGAAGGARMAFKPSGATDGSNLYIYRAPTNLGYRGPGASPSPPAASPPPAAGAAAASAGGIARGPPSATDSKMLGGPGRDYKFPSKADYTPYGPKNAPYAQAPAGGRPVTNAFRQPTLQPHMKSTRSQPRRPGQRHPADIVSGKAQPAASKSPKTPAEDDDEPWDPVADSADDEDDDDGVRHRTGGPVPRRVKPARPSSAFRGASPRQAPPEAFQPVVEEIALAMTVTNGKPPKKKRLPGTAGSSRAASKAASQAASKSASAAASQAGSVAGTDRSSKKPAVDPVDPDDPFADYAAADAVANDSPRSHVSHRSHVSARSSTSTQHSAGWYTRNFHFSGDPVKDLALLSETAKTLQKQVDAQRKAEVAQAALEGDGDGEEKDGSGQQGQDDEEETFAEDNGAAQDDQQDQEEQQLDEEAQQQADEDAAEANEQQQQLLDDENADDQQHQGPAPDDDEVVSGPDEADQESKDESASAPPPAADPPAPVRKLRPAGKLNVWAAAEPLTNIPHLYTPSQWGAQTRAEQGAGLGRTLPLGSTLGSTLAGRSLAPVRPNTNGNETSDIDTENDTGLSGDDSHDDEHAAESKQQQQDAEEEESKQEQSAEDLEQQAQEEAAALAADASASPEPSGGDDDDGGDFDREAEALNDEDDDAGDGGFDGTITALHSFPIGASASAAAASADPDASAYSDSDPFAEHAERDNMLATTSTFLVQQAPLSRTSKGATLRKSGAPPMPMATAAQSAVPSAVTAVSSGVAAKPAISAPPSGLMTDDSDDEGVHALLSSSNSSKSLFANIMQASSKAAAAAAPVIKPPPPKRVVSTAELLLSPPLSPSTSSVAPTPTAAAAAASSSATAAASAPAPVDYMSVLKRKGVLAPATEAQKAERREDALSLKDAAAQRERLRIQEQQLLERKWKQIQAEEQALGSASEGEGGFGEDNTLPSVRSTARQEVDTTRSNKSARSSANSSRASSHKSSAAAAAAAAATASTSASSAASSARSQKAAVPGKAPTPLKSKVPAAWSNAPPATGLHSPIAAPSAPASSFKARPASSSGVRMSRAPPVPAPVRTPSPEEEDVNAATAAFSVHQQSEPFGATTAGGFGEEAEIPSSDAAAEESMMRLEDHDEDDESHAPAGSAAAAAALDQSFSDDPFDSSFSAPAHAHRSEIPQSPAHAAGHDDEEEEERAASPLPSPKPQHAFDASDAEADPAEASFAASEDDPFASM